MAELIGARIVVLVLLSSKRCEIVAKSRVKPAKMLMLRSLPRTSERITLSLPLPPVLAPGDEEVGGEARLAVLGQLRPSSFGRGPNGSHHGRLTRLSALSSVMVLVGP